MIRKYDNNGMDDEEIKCTIRGERQGDRASNAALVKKRV